MEVPEEHRRRRADERAREQDDGRDRRRVPRPREQQVPEGVDHRRAECEHERLGRHGCDARRVVARAIVFDFNGTLSDDEPILCEIFGNLFAEHGRPMSAQEYFDELAGLSDPEIVRTWLGPDHPDVDAVIGERVARYRAAVADGSSVPERTRAAVRYAAERVPLAICSGAAHAEIEPVVEASGLEP